MPASLRSRRIPYPSFVTGVLFFCAALNYADRTAVSSVFPLLQHDFGMSDVALAAIGSLFLWSYAFASPVAGLLADRFSRSRLVVFSLLAWSLVTTLTAFSPSESFLLSARVLLGLSECLYLPAAIALIADYHSDSSRGSAMAMLLQCVCLFAASPFLLSFIWSKNFLLVSSSVFCFELFATMAASAEHPILCDVLDPRLRSTAIGCMNTANCLAGGAGIFLAGVFKHDLGLGTIFGCASSVILLAALLVLVGYVFLIDRDLKRRSGSTPTALFSAGFQRVTEIRPGMYPFYDGNMIGAAVVPVEDCALSVLVTVVSTAVGGKVILDGGSKTFSSDRFLSGYQRGFGLVVQDPDAELEALSEEHGHLSITASSRTYRLRERLRVIPNHVCSTINMHERIYGIRGDRVETSWVVAGHGKLQ